MKLSAACLLALLLLAACGTPWRAKYFSEGINKLTQDDVVKRLGPPTATHNLNSGELVWQYRYYDSSVVGSGGNVVGETVCIGYILTFDRDQVLRNWVRQGC